MIPAPAQGSLADILPAVGALLGVPDTIDRIGLAAVLPAHCTSVVVLLVDGMGAQLLDAHPELTTTLSGGADLGRLLSPIPSTTAAAVTSFGTGLPVGTHGIMGSAFEVDGTPLWPLNWGTQPNPIATQPEPTMFQRMTAAGVGVASAAPAKFRGSGLTMAALRGGSYPGADSVAERVAVVADELARARAAGWASCTYVYWPELDKAGHVHGVDSQDWRSQLEIADRLVAELVAALTPGTALLVTADHGMLDVADSARVDLDDRHGLGLGVRRVLGEPRLRHIYCEPGQSGAVLRRWRAALAGYADVIDRAEAAERWFAPLDPWNSERVGDVVAMATGTFSLVSDRVDRVVSNLRGQHGADTPVEREVPLLAWVG